MKVWFLVLLSLSSGLWADGEFLPMVQVPGGVFELGDTAGRGDEDEYPVSKVTVGSFLMGRTEVTQAQWKAVMGTNPSHTVGDDYPVETVTWFQALAFCNALSVREGWEPAYAFEGETVQWNRNANGYRLPTEAEWEFAAKGAERGALQNLPRPGGTDVETLGWYTGNSGGQTHPVALKTPNALGLFDLVGNVDEWCFDLKHPYLEAPISASRVSRGGSFADPMTHLRCSYRMSADPHSLDCFQGFRVVRSFPKGF